MDREVRRVVATTVMAALCVLVILSSVFPIPQFPSIGTPSQVMAQSWLSGWDYRKELTINGTSVGNQTDYQMRLEVTYNRSISAVQPHMTLHGVVLEEGDPDEWDDEAISCGPVVDYYGTLRMLYGGSNSSASPRLWCVGGANSTDGGETWAKEGKFIDPPSGYESLHPAGMDYDGGNYTLFATGRVNGGGNWDIVYYTSTNYSTWDYGGFVVDNTTLGLSGPVTNPSSIRVGSDYYLTVSYDANKGIRLLKSSSLTSGYSDLGFIIEAANATSPYYGNKCLDSKIFEYGSQYVVVFSGEKTGGSRKRQLMFAYNNGDIDTLSDWHVVYDPWCFFNDNDVFQGRTANYFDGDTLQIWADGNVIDGDSKIWYFYLEPYRVLTLDENCEADFGDVRYTNNDGTTEFFYWLENKIDGDYATFWVEVDSISTGNSTAYIYYGNTGASTTSSGNNTFVAETFDQFDGTSLNTSRWEEWNSNGSYSVSGGNLTVTGGSGSWENIGCKIQVGSGYAFRTRSQFDEQDRTLVGFDDRSNNGTHAGSGTDDAYFRYNSGKSYVTAREGSAESSTRYTILTGLVDLEVQWQSSEVVFLEGNVLMSTHTTQVPADDMGGSFGAYGSSTDCVVDWVCVRKCADPEPTWIAFGNEDAEACSPSISLNTSSWDAGGVAISSNYSSGLAYFTITNNSGGAVDITIGGADMTGGGYTWDLADDGSAGDMVVALYAGREGEAYNIIVRETATYNTLVAGLADSGTQNFGLTMCTPTNFDDGNDKSGNVTLTVVCS